MTIILYVSSVSGSLELKKKQSHLEMVLQGKKIAFETRDVAASEEYRNFMKAKSGHTTAPQIFNGDTYIGDYEAFEQAIEDGNLESFLQL